MAQPGSALAWGARGRQFESGLPDQQEASTLVLAFFIGRSACLHAKAHKEKAKANAASQLLVIATQFKMAEGNLVFPTERVIIWWLFFLYKAIHNRIWVRNGYR